MGDNTIDICLLSFQAIFWAFFVYRLWIRNRLYAIFCMVLYLYLLPTEITYRFFPSLYSFYWGPDVWYVSYWFINFSLLSLLIVLNFTNRKQVVYDVVRYKASAHNKKIWSFIVTFSVVATYLLVNNITAISYQSLVENGAMGNEDTTLLIIDLMIKNLPYFVIFPIVAKKDKKWYIQLFLTYNILLFIAYNILSGSRSDILAVILGLILLWMFERKIGLKQILILTIIAIGFLYLAGLVYNLRGGSNEGSLEEILLKQDYTPPAYNLFGVIGKDLVDSLMVIYSQLSKSFPLLGGEWIYMTIGEKLFPEIEFSASQGLAFHPFTEGYLFAGFLGFLYNGLVLGLGLAFWNRFISTNDKNFNQFMFAIIGSIFFALVRAQSIYFFRYIYFVFLPAAFIYSHLCRIEIRYYGFFRRHSNKNNKDKASSDNSNK